MPAQRRYDGHSVAITGMSCRFPGDGDDPNQFWESICHGESAWSEIPKNRFNADAFHSAAGNVHTSITKGAHFLKRDITKFDANFFGLSNAEAKSMDPQHRMMIEVAYQGLESAGLSLKDVADSRTGVFIGHFSSDYRDMIFRDPESAPTYTFSGIGKTSLANRISWLFDLKGPSFSLDTACSSSLVALHLACQSLRTGESDIAIVGGVNLILNPELFMYLSTQHFLSPDGKCKSFDESGNGYGRGEGIAAIVLKRVDDAIAGNDPIRAVIRGTGSNQDGHTRGFTLPSAEAQARLIRETYAAAELDFKDTRYVEAHGTGTQAGDVEETMALSETISKERSSSDPLYIGSVKSNIGHLEACAGLAGIVKSVLILESGLIPSTIHYKKGNPKIRFQEWGLEVPTTLIPWPSSGLRRISVNSFGYGGTNAHAVLEDAYHYLEGRAIQAMHFTQVSRRDYLTSRSSKNTHVPSSTQNGFSGLENGISHATQNGFVKSKVNGITQDFTKGTQNYSTNGHTEEVKQPHTNGYVNGNANYYTNGHVNGAEKSQSKSNDESRAVTPHLFQFSAQDKEGLKRTKETLAGHLSKCINDENLNSQTNLADLSFTLSRRATLQWRTSTTASSIQQLYEKLGSGETAPITRARAHPRIGFVFTGQGAQWPKMGIELMDYPIFRESIQAADRYLKGACSCPWSVEEELTKGKFSSRLHLAEFSQTICTVLQVAIVDLLRSWKITPVAVAGHSSGEIAAAYCLGALTPENAWAIAYYRGVVSTGLKTVAPDISGSMMAVGTSPEKAQKWIAQAKKGDVVIACVNSPSSVTLSGDTAGIDEMSAKFAEAEIFARKLKVDTAYHSPHMQIVAQDYLEYIEDIEPNPQTGTCRMHSSVTGRQIQPNELGAANWVRNLISPVQFAAAIHDMVRPMQDDGNRSEENAIDLLIEIGPHPALQGPSTQTLKSHGIVDMPYETVLRRDHDGVQSALDLAGAVFARGGQLDSLAVNNEGERNDVKLLIDLPSYSWNHSQDHWQESRLSKEYRNRKQPSLSLLGAPNSSFAQGEYKWRKYVRLSEEPWISDHQIESSIVYPGAGYLAMAFEAAHQIADPNQQIAGFQLRDVQLTAALVVSEDTDIECIVQLRPHFSSTRDNASTWMEFVVTTSPDAETLVRNCTGLLLIDYEQAKNSSISSERSLEADHLRHQYLEAVSSCQQNIVPEEFYQDLYQMGLKYGPVFTNLKEIRRGDGLSLCAVDIPRTGSKSTDVSIHRPHIIHPGTLDAMFHCAFAAVKGGEDEMKQAMVPTAIDEVYVSADIPYQPETRMSGFSTAEKHGFKGLKSDITMFAAEITRPVVRIVGFTCMEVGSSVSALDDLIESKSLCSKLTWKPAIQLLPAEEVGRVIRNTYEKDHEANLETSIKRDEANAVTCVGDLLKTVALDKIPASKQEFWHWMQTQHDLAKDSNSPSQRHMSHTAPEEAEDTDAGKLFIGLKAHLTADTPELDKTIIDSRSELYMANAAIGSLLGQLSEYLRLLHFSNPRLSILELSSDSAVMGSSTLLKHLSGVETLLETAQYTVACPNRNALADAKERFSDVNNGVDFVVLDSEKSLETQELQNQKFDVVIAFDLANSSKHPDIALANASNLLKEDGAICVLDISNPGLYLSLLTGSGGSSKNSLTAMLPEHQLNVHLTLSDATNPRLRQAELLILQAAAEVRANHDDEEIVIIRPARLSAKTITASQHVSEALTKVSCRTSFFSWGSDLSALKGKPCVSLLELENSMLSDISEHDFQSLKTLITETKRIFWIVGFDGPSSETVNGLARVIRNEIPGLSFQTAHIRVDQSPSLERLSSTIVRVLRSNSEDNEFRIKDDIVSISRLEEDVEANKQVQALLPDAPDIIDMVPLGQADGGLKLCIQTAGMLDSLCFDADDLPLTDLETDQIEIDVKATALNFREVMVVMGQIPDRLLGFDAAGIVRRVGSGVSRFRVGDKVAMYGHGSHRTIHRSKADFCALIPDGLSFEQAATIPVVHGTAWYGLVQLAQVRKGQTILIHAAAGGVGQAAIQIAQYYQMDIIATVGSESKRKLLRDKYWLSDDHILSSRDLSFVKGVKRLTGGRGVDVILNSLSGEFLRQTWNCIAPFGTFLEIGIKDILNNTELDMRPFLQGASYTFYNINQIEKERPDMMGKIITETFEFQRRKITRPITPLKTYPISDVVNAFRLMQAGKHLGKVVLSFGEADNIPVIRRAAESFKLDSNAVYLVIGGLGGLGRSISKLLVDQGARKICFLSRSGGRSAEAQKLLQELRDRKVQVEAYACDVADPKAASKSISKCLMELGPIRGVLQCAMVLRDVLFTNMNYSEWVEASRPKIQGTWNVSSNLPDLDFFVCLSSFAAIFGNRGQSNYAAGGAYQDAVAHYRRSLGQHAVTIDLGIIRDVGVLAEKGITESLREWEKPFGIQEPELHALLKRVIGGDIKSDIAPQVVTGLATGGSAMIAGISTPYYLQDDARFSIMSRTGVRAQQGISGNSAGQDAGKSTQALLSTASSMQEATQIVTDALVRRVAKMLQTSESEIDPGAFLNSYGVDSLTAIEIVNWALKELKATVSVIDVTASVPITTTAGKITSSSALCQALVSGKA